MIPPSLKNQSGRQPEVLIVLVVVGIVVGLIGPRIIEWTKQYGQECAQIPVPGVSLFIFGLLVFWGGYIAGALLAHR